MAEAQVVFEGWRQHHNTGSLHSSFDYSTQPLNAMLWLAAQLISASPTPPTVASEPIMDWSSAGRLSGQATWLRKAD